ncbi:hypothetical protein VTO42DRAFT_8441 [Malbranchea cinnamomea]
MKVGGTLGAHSKVRVEREQQGEIAKRTTGRAPLKDPTSLDLKPTDCAERGNWTVQTQTRCGSPKATIASQGALIPRRD